MSHEKYSEKIDPGLGLLPGCQAGALSRYIARKFGLVYGETGSVSRQADRILNLSETAALAQFLQTRIGLPR